MTRIGNRLCIGNFAAGILLVLAAVAMAQAEEQTPGIKVGEKAPHFTLEDQQGKEQSLERLLKQGNVAIVFHRSADW